MPAGPANPTYTTGNFHRIEAAVGAWRLAVVSTSFAHAVDQSRPGIAAVGAWWLTLSSAHRAQAVLESQPAIASVVTGNLTDVAAVTTEALCHPEARFAPLVAWRLRIVAADVAQAIAEIESRVASPIARLLAFAAAGAAGPALVESPRVVFALEEVTHATRGCLGGIRRTARGTVLGAAGEAAMALPVARALVAHLSQHPIVRRVDLAVRRPFRCPCFRAVAAHLAGAAAG